VVPVLQIAFLTLSKLADTAWATRGVFKAEAKKIVVEHYHLHPPEALGVTGPDAHRRAIEFTKDRVNYLLTDYRFLYGSFNNVSVLNFWVFMLIQSQREDTPFADTALCLVIERSLFRSMSFHTREVLNPMPASLLALAAVCVRRLHPMLPTVLRHHSCTTPLMSGHPGTMFVNQ
jgi:hypothetical protein